MLIKSKNLLSCPTPCFWLLCSCCSLCAGPGGACGSLVRGLHEKEEQDNICLVPGAWGGRRVFRGVRRWGVSAGGGPNATNTWPQRLEGIRSESEKLSMHEHLTCKCLHCLKYEHQMSHLWLVCQNQDHYAVLGLSNLRYKATQKQIKAAREYIPSFCSHGSFLKLQD